MQMSLWRHTCRWIRPIPVGFRRKKRIRRLISILISLDCRFSFHVQADYGNYEWYPLSLAEEKTKETVKEFFYHKEDKMRYKPFRAGTPMAAMTLYSATIFK